MLTFVRLYFRLALLESILCRRMKSLSETIYLVASIQGFLVFLGLIAKKTKNRVSNIAIGLLIFVFTIELLFSWGGKSGYNNLPNAFPIWKLLSYLLIPPALWLFMEANTNSRFRFTPKILFLFLPAFLEISSEFAFLWINKSFSYQPNRGILGAKLWFFFVEILPIAATIAVLVMYIRRLKRIQQSRTDFKNPAVHTYLRRMLIIWVFFAVFVGLWILSTFLLIQFEIVSVSLSIALFVLGYVAYFKPDFFEMPNLFLFKNSGSQQFANFDDKQEVVRLKSVFEEKSLHLRPKLSLAELAGELKLPPKYVSYLIGNCCGSNFNDFVNAYRVREVIDRLNAPSEKHKTLLGIALDAGFSSKSTFNQVFKQHTGKTPSEFLS